MRKRRSRRVLKNHRGRFKVLKNSNISRMTISGLEELISELNNIKKTCNKCMELNQEISQFLNKVEIEFSSRTTYKIRVA